MKIINWQCQMQPNRPAYCLTKRIFKVHTIGFEAPALNELYSLIWEYMHHTFLITNDDPSAFWNAPPNVVPLLHSDDFRHFRSVEKEFLEVTEGRQYRGVSFYLKHNAIITDHNYDIAVLNGTNYEAIFKTINTLKGRKTPCYVESYKFKPYDIPEPINIKQFPKRFLDNDNLGTNLFLYEFRKEYYQLTGHNYPTITD